MSSAETSGENVGAHIEQGLLFAGNLRTRITDTVFSLATSPVLLPPSPILLTRKQRLGEGRSLVQVTQH